MENITVKDLVPSIKKDREIIKEFLAENKLKMEPLTHFSGIFAGDVLIGGGGYYQDTIKCVAVNDSYRGAGFMNTLITRLRSQMQAEGQQNIFVYTKPENEHIFSSLAFYTVGRAEEAILMESNKYGVSTYQATLAKYQGDGIQGAIVMNANPFSNGHLHLVREASKKCSALHVFVVEENLSVFPFELRKRLVEEGTRDLGNVTVHASGKYIISGTTFPAYFLKEDSDRASVQAELDADIFGNHIAKALHISTRFFGNEPKDPMTFRYVQAMKKVLPRYSVTPIVMERIKYGERIISASAIREAIQLDDWETVANMAPPSTVAYLKSADAKPVVERLLNRQSP